MIEPKNLPTTYQLPKRSTFVSDILNKNDLKNALMKHSKQKDLSRYDTEKFRNTFKKQICIWMLMKGFHKSFAEVLDLIQIQINIRHELGCEHPIWNKPLIMQETVKFEFLCSKLNFAEEGQRKRDFKNVFNTFQELAKYFQSDDQWLSDYFFKKCLDIVSNGKSVWEARKAAETHCYLGKSYEQQADDYTAKSEKIKTLYFLALNHYENFYNLCKNQDWIDESTQKNEDNLNHNKKLFTDACIHLQRIYKIISEKYYTESNEKIGFLIKALDVCRESGLKIHEGQISYTLGIAYQENEQYDIALVSFNNYYEISKKMNDTETFGEASEALASCYKKMGNLTMSIEYLKTFIDGTVPDLVNLQYGKICSSLASIYNSMGAYKMATNLSKKSFEIFNQIGKKNASELNRIVYATAKAHENLKDHTLNIEKNTKDSLKNLVKSKYEIISDKLAENKF